MTTMNEHMSNIGGDQKSDERVRYLGFNGYCGVEFEAVTEEYCRISCRLREELLNPAGMAHGGLIATLADVAAGAMATKADGYRHNIVTQSCSIQYLRPGIGERLYSESRVIRKGKRVCVVRVDCFRDDGALCSTANYEIAYL